MSILDLMAGLAGYERAPAPRASKEVEAPYSWPMWADGEPMWTAPSLPSYATEGFQGNPLIYACIARKAETAAVAPLRAYTGQRDKPMVVQDGDDLAALLLRPNGSMSWFELQELLIVYLELDGNTYLYKARERTGGPVAGLFPLRPDLVRPVPGGGGILGYVYEPEGGGARIPFLAEEIIDVKYPNPLDMFEGLGRGRPPLMAAARVGDVDNQVTKFLKQFFDNAVVPFGLLKSKQKLADSEVGRIRQRLRAQYAGLSHWGDVMILDADAEYQRLGLSMQELGFESLDARNEARICMVLKVPPILVGAKVGLDRSTFANYGEARTSFWEDTMLPLYKRFEDQFNLQLAEEFPGRWLAYDFADVPALRKDDTAKWETAVRAFLGGIAKRSEARALAGLTDPVPAELDGFRAAAEQQIGAPAITQTPAGVASTGSATGAGSAGGKAAASTGSATGKAGSAAEMDERMAIEARAVRRVGEALSARWEVVRPGSEADVAATEARLAESAPAMRDALYQALRPAALAGVDAARRAVEAELTGGGEAASRGGGSPSPQPSPKGRGGQIEDGKQAPVIDWTLVATYVLQWLDTYSFELIRDLDETARGVLRGAIQRWAENGLPLSDLVDELVDLGLFDRARAELIASTEVTRAYAMGQMMAWQQTGVVTAMRWNTANDERVCPICGPLGGLEFGADGTVPGSIEQQLSGGVVTELGQPFVHPGGDGRAGNWAGHTFELPPAHPRCRCWITAVV